VPRKARGRGTALPRQLVINPRQLRHVGYGESRPVADYNTAEGRALNRRVEVEAMTVKK
jgi:outer membrane protein OmpA-like peptidoglycan-associated protein